jgi:N-acyl-D-aspartate/D-glutamate deacylase
MSIDWDSQLLDPIYDQLGIAAAFVARDGKRADLTVIDKTDGVESISNGLVLQGKRPAACVRVAELATNRLVADDMRNGRLTFAGASWNVESAKPNPVPGGKGELMLFLQERNDG